MIQNAPNCTYIEEKTEMTVHERVHLYDEAYKSGYRDAVNDIENKTSIYVRRKLKMIFSRGFARKHP